MLFMWSTVSQVIIIVQPPTYRCMREACAMEFDLSSFDLNPFIIEEAVIWKHLLMMVFALLLLQKENESCLFQLWSTQLFFLN